MINGDNNDQEGEGYEAYFSQLWFGFGYFFCWISLLTPQNHRNQTLSS
jgi:hypothetical protein